MHRKTIVSLLAASSLGFATPSLAQHVGHGPPAPPSTLSGWAQGAKLYDGLGTFHRKITTRSPEAQRYFDQGMRFVWAFNHDEATRSFAKAAELDPKCGACFWGVALTLGMQGLHEDAHDLRLQPLRQILAIRLHWHTTFLI